MVKMGRSKFKNNLFVFYTVLFLILSFPAFYYLYKQDKNRRTKLLNENLGEIARLVENYLAATDTGYEDFEALDFLKGVLPREDLLLSVIDTSSDVLYGYGKEETISADNRDRPAEIGESLLNGTATSIRTPNGMDGLYYFFAENFGDHIVRVAVPYSSDIVECKAPEVPINEKVFDQIACYNMGFKVPYLIVTNGIEHYACKIDTDTNSYAFLLVIPLYDELVNSRVCTG
jgi:hypothetical protein